MIDVKALENKDFDTQYRKDLQHRGEDPGWVDKIVEQNTKRKSLILEMETCRAEQNRVGTEIAKMKRAGQDSSRELEAMQELAAKVKELDLRAKAADDELKQILLRLPNKLHSSVPVGNSADDNVEVRRVGEPRKFAFEPKEHGELGESLRILDFDRAAKVAGARFTFLRGAAARMERALIQFMMDVHSREHTYEEMIPPFIANYQSFEGTGQFPKFREDVFHLTGYEYALIPTAEVPLTNFYNGEILEEADLPQRFVAYSPCFRSEAGSYGKDTKGLIRQHQFNKVELMVYSHPDESYKIHDQLTGHAENILKKLELPYRVMVLCSKDIGFGAAKCYDLEVWLPSAKNYREISSCSNFEDFQARRANIRYRPGDKGKPRFVHTLNGSGLAVGRTLIAIMENYQQEDGSIAIPAALQPYMGGAKLIQRPS
jgi:seryl-tRNA synthetase